MTKPVGLIIEIVLHAINILTHFFIYADANRLPPWGNHYPLVKNYLNVSSGTTGARRKSATSLSLTRDLQPRFASVAKGRLDTQRWRTSMFKVMELSQVTYFLGLLLLCHVHIYLPYHLRKPSNRLTQGKSCDFFHGF